MRTRLVITLIVSLFATMPLLAQEIPLPHNPQSHTKIYLGRSPESENQDFRVLQPMSADSLSRFRNHLKSLLLAASHERTEMSLRHHYNMPILKPEKTSKILIAKLDPNSPYTYAMPVIKTDIGN